MTRRKKTVKPKIEVYRPESPDYQFGCKYHFCEGCEHKTTIMKGEKVIRYSCPARFDPYEVFDEDTGRGCPNNKRFLEREKSKMEYGRGRNR